MKLQKKYYLNDDVLFIAKDLIGKVLYTQIDGITTAGIITETEAYKGISDKASHAYNNKRTPRTETMFAEGGVSYAYLIYGMYHLFNVVTNHKDIPDAVLVRSIYPYKNEKLILKRRNAEKWHKNLLNGPGKLTLGLGISKQHNNIDLMSNQIWIEDRQIKIDDSKIKTTPRIGIDYAEEDALLPYRFVFENYKNL